MKPSYVIIGGVKCASSSLYRYLNEHPQVLPCKTKEPGYLNNRNLIRLFRGYKSYINLFPNLDNKEVVANWLEIGEDMKMKPSTFSKEIKNGTKYITGEASATTFVNANPRIVKFLFPQIKAILSLRNPTERFISHFAMFKRFEIEGKKGHRYGTIEEFIDIEIKAFNNKERTKILSQGVYIDYLPKWEKTFGNNLKVIHSNKLQEENALSTLNEITSFLGLDSYNYASALEKKHNVSPARQSNKEAEEKLNAFYRPHNEALFSRYNITL
jgi:hypothetical protein